MPMYLSSEGIVPGTGHLQAPEAGSRAFVVLNALDQFDRTRDRELPEHVDALAALGWEVAELDLRRFDGDAVGLRRALTDASLVWVVGGNSFVLAHAMAASGFGTVTRRLLAANPDFVYGGFSAGAVVAGPDLQGIELVDDPHPVVAGVPLAGPVDGLGLVPFRIVPHYRSDHPESPAIELVAEAMAERGLALHCLRDGQALWIDESGITPLP